MFILEARTQMKNHVSVLFTLIKSSGLHHFRAVNQ